MRASDIPPRAVAVASASEILGARPLLIHCEDETARSFYLHLGKFKESPTDPLHLFLLMSDLRKTSGMEAPA